MKTRHLLSLLLLSFGLSCSKDDKVTPFSPTSNTQSPKHELVLNQFLGESISLEQAEQVLPMLSRKSKGLRSIGSLQIKSSYPIGDSDKTLLYIINYKPSGYAIVSASRNITPILAYSDKGEINPTRLSASLRFLIERYKEQVRTGEDLPSPVKRQNAIAWESLELSKGKLRSLSLINPAYIENQIQKLQSEGYQIYDYQNIISGFNPYLMPGEYQMLFDNGHGSIEQGNENIFMIAKEMPGYYEEIKPLVETKWDQFGNYSKYAPNHKENKPAEWPIGCVAVAVGQIMHYHKYPTAYNWREMPIDYPTDTTAMFLYKVACGVKTSFGVKGSGSNIKKAANFLKETGYTLNIVDPFVASAVCSSLDRGLPAYIRGSERADEGHAFIADGYQRSNHNTSVKIIRLVEYGIDDATPLYYETLWEKTIPHNALIYLHLNLGWGGSEDGYYNSDNLNGLNQDVKALINIQPKNK